MESIQWREKYNIGDKKIDSDHQKIVSLLQNLQLSNDTCLDPDETNRIFSDLQEYAADHFSYEESVLEKIDFPFIASHKKDHAFFIKTLQSWQNDEAIDCKSQKISMFLTEWLFEHILHYDMKIKDYLKNGTEAQS